MRHKIPGRASRDCYRQMLSLITMMLAILFLMEKNLLAAVRGASVMNSGPSTPSHPLHTTLQDVQLKMQFFPLEHRVEAVAELTWKTPQKLLTFTLNHNLRITADQNYQIVSETRHGLAQTYQLQFHQLQTKARLHYAGVINEPIQEGESPGIITDSGISLLSESFWHPSFKEEAPWTVEVELPNADWKVMMPGTMTDLGGNRFRFQSYIPTNEWALVADRFHIFKLTSPSGKLIQVWLKENQPQLAQSYLELVPDYIEHYAQIIGAFPFSGYAVVENSLETGYAFPGFTLLGPSVIRLPFLLRSSLPHEILHSWWGNSVLVDYERGNWCEGLTTYMADHFYAIQDGKGAEYRRASLQNFHDFVTKDRDFPLRRFVSRHDRGSQAVGYGKSMMLFQMLENHLGPHLFYGALSQFFHQNLWKNRGYGDVQKSFENYTHTSLDSFFTPWLDQTGAPKISITQLELQNDSITLSLKQERLTGEKAYLLPIRVRVLYLEGSVQNQLLTLEQEEQTFVFPKLTQNGKSLTPAKLWVDPDFEVFRTLYPEETPFAMSQILVDKEIVTVSIPVTQKEQYQAWLKALQKIYSKPLNVITDQDSLPTSGPLWIIGSSNAHGSLLSPLLQARQIEVIENQLQYNSKVWNLSQSAVFVGENSNNRPVVWAWANPEQPASLLVQKITHYTSFSIVGFTEQKNDFKQTWPVLASPLIRSF